MLYVAQKVHPTAYILERLIAAWLSIRWNKEPSINAQLMRALIGTQKQN